MVTEADPGNEVWVTSEYNVTSGWSPVTPRDTLSHDTWGALAEAQRDALTRTVMEAHNYSEDVARRHFSGTDVTDEATVMLITHDLTAPPPPPLTPPPLPHGRSVRRRGEAGLRRQPAVRRIARTLESSVLPYVLKRLLYILETDSTLTQYHI